MLLIPLHYGGELVPHPSLIDIVAKRHGVKIDDPRGDMNQDYDKTQQYYLEANEERYARSLLLRSDPKRFNHVLARLRDDYALGNNNYPTIRQQASSQ